MSNTLEATGHVEEAYRLLTGQCYRGTGPDDMQPVEGICTLVMDPERIDSALGPRGHSPFAAMAQLIEAVYTEIKMARIALDEGKRPRS